MKKKEPFCQLYMCQLQLLLHRRLVPTDMWGCQAVKNSDFNSTVKVVFCYLRDSFIQTFSLKCSIKTNKSFKYEDFLVRQGKTLCIFSTELHLTSDQQLVQRKTIKHEIQVIRAFFLNLTKIVCQTDIIILIIKNEFMMGRICNKTSDIYCYW